MRTRKVLLKELLSVSLRLQVLNVAQIQKVKCRHQFTQDVMQTRAVSISYLTLIGENKIKVLGSDNLADNLERIL